MEHQIIIKKQILSILVNSANVYVIYVKWCIMIIWDFYIFVFNHNRKAMYLNAYLRFWTVGNKSLFFSDCNEKYKSLANLKIKLYQKPNFKILDSEDQIFAPYMKNKLREHFRSTLFFEIRCGTWPKFVCFFGITIHCKRCIFPDVIIIFYQKQIAFCLVNSDNAIDFK